MPERDSFNWEVKYSQFICNACHCPSLEMYTSDQIKICVNCADEIANHYHHERSGRYLTWTNPTNKTTHKKVKIPEGIRWEVYERDNFTCRKCGSRRHLSIDHITPESAGGSLSADNLQTLCQTCNKKKGVRGC